MKIGISSSIMTFAVFTSISGVMNLAGTNLAYAQQCGSAPVPNVSVSDLSVSLPSNGCNYKVMDRDNGYSEVCNSWNNTSCRTLVNGHRYQVDKWTGRWAGAGKQFFTASGSSGSEAGNPGNNPIDSLSNNSLQDCNSSGNRTAVLPDGMVRDFSRWKEWRRCTPNGNVDTVVRSAFTGEDDLQTKAEDWTGTGSVKQSSDGRQFEITWNNEDPRISDTVTHREFDISIGRALHGAGARLGYGLTKADTFRGRAPTMMASAKFIEPVTSGTAHVQGIIWLNKEQGQDANSDVSGRSCTTNPSHYSSRESVDITVVEWLTQNLRNEYNKILNGTPASQTFLSRKTTHVDYVRLNGVKYEVYKREPGDFCELASYFLVRQWNQDYNNGYKYSALNLADVIDKVSQVDDKNFGDWYLSSAGWEIAGANESGGANGDEAKLRFQCVSLPSLNTATARTAGGAC